MSGTRADIALVERGLFPSRAAARAAILAGEVRADGEVIAKAGQPLPQDAAVEVAERPRYVSRGGRKLEGALSAFGLDVTGAVALDVGASTGGFTDCLLQHGAVSVVALDVGYGQLAWRLRTDPRVRVLERTNIRTVDPAQLEGPFDVVVIDVSFIGLVKVLPYVLPLVAENGVVAALVKPQFEAGKGRVGKKGVVRDPSTHEAVLEDVVAFVAEQGWAVRSLAFSPIKGPEGNIEFWALIAHEGPMDTSPAQVVRRAHEVLGE